MGALIGKPKRAYDGPERLAGAPEMTEATLWWGMIFGAIGVGFFMYGKKQRSPVPLVCGLGLMVFPYFVSNSWLVFAIGVGLMAVPYFVRL